MADKTEDFQKQAREMLRAQQETYVAAVKAWREASPPPASGDVQPPPSPQPTPMQMLPTPTEMAEAYYAFAAKLLADQSRFMEALSQAMAAPEEEATPRALMDRAFDPRVAGSASTRPFPPSIEPQARTGLEMFRTTLARGTATPPWCTTSTSRSPPGRSTRCRMRWRWRCSGAAPSRASASRCTCRTSRRCSSRCSPPGSAARSSCRATRCCASGSWSRSCPTPAAAS